MARLPHIKSVLLRRQGEPKPVPHAFASLSLIGLCCSLMLSGCGGSAPRDSQIATSSATSGDRRPTREEIEAAAALSVLSGTRKSYASDYARISDCAAALQFVEQQLRERQLASPEQLQILAQASAQFQQNTRLLGQREGKDRADIDAEVRAARQQFARQPAEAVGTAAACAREASRAETKV